MEDRMIIAVQNWLNAIMPAVVETLVATLTEETLREMAKEEGIHGPVDIDLEEFRAPIKAIKFYTIVVNDGLMLATDATIDGASADAEPQLSFDMFFPISKFAESISDEEHIQQLVDHVMELYKSVA